MGRTVISKQDVKLQMQRARAVSTEGRLAADVAPPQLEKPDEYRDRLIKYIPADVVAIYLALIGLVKMLPANAPSQTVRWIIFSLILFVSIPWQRKIAKIAKWKQVWIGTGAFTIWAISLGDPFTTAWATWYYPVYGTMAVALYTFLIPLLEA